MVGQRCSATVGITFLPVQTLEQHLILGCYLWVLTQKKKKNERLMKLLYSKAATATQCLKETDFTSAFEGIQSRCSVVHHVIF
jgi:hypothetical protein